MTSPTGSDLKSQGQNQVWNTDFLDPDPGSLLLRGLQKAGRTREAVVPGGLSSALRGLSSTH